MTSLKLDVAADQDGKCLPPVSSPLPTYMNEDAMGTDKLVVVLVGMPARGKSYIAKKLSAYLNWGSHKTDVFNVGQHRRVMTHENQSSEFFDPANASAKELREKLATEVLESAIHFLKYEGGQVAIFDATNTTAARRAKVSKVCALAGVRYLFIESVCDDKRVLESNFQTKVRNSPDYKNMPYEEAVKDLSQRIANYEKAYEPVTDEENLPYIKLINLNSKVVCYHVFGRLPRPILFYLMSIHIARRPVWLCRAGHCKELDANGEPMMDFQGRRMDTELSELGWEFAQGLADFIKSHEPAADSWYQKGDLVVFTSMLTRAAQTASLIGVPPQRISSLNMMDKGVCDGMSIKQIQQQLPEVQHQFESDPFNFRVPGGESYADVVKRLDTIVIDLERYTKPVLIVSHLSALRVLYAYFSNQPVEKCPFLDIPQHCIVQLTPTQYGWTETRHFPCKSPLIGNRSFSDIEFPRIPLTPSSHQNNASFLNSPGFQPASQSKQSTSQPNSARVTDLTRTDSKTREAATIVSSALPSLLPPAASADKS